MSKNVFLKRVDTFWHETSYENNGFAFWHASACKHVLTRGCFLTRFDTNLNTYGARARVSKKVSTSVKNMVFDSFDTFWHECKHLWSQSWVFGFWHVLIRGGVKKSLTHIPGLATSAIKDCERVGFEAVVKSAATKASLGRLRWQPTWSWPWNFRQAEEAALAADSASCIGCKCKACAGQSIEYQYSPKR